ncbi:sugar O-acetyltransferase, partial [Vibrio sp.]|nr:sugar O-acetyltransferase [Vibrio sp.]
MSLTEKQKMLRGELYQGWDAELAHDRAQAKKRCHQLNLTCPTDISTRRDIIATIFGFTSDAHIESPFYCDYGYNTTFGKSFYANHGCTILDCAKVMIGDNCLLGPGVIIATPNHPLDPISRAAGDEIAHTITIGNDVWLAANVTVCPGVTIGDNVIVGAGSTVTKDLPANTLCVGSPAVPIRSIT